MERIVTEICNKDLKKDVFANAQFIFFAESGAMGEPGKVLIVTSGGSIFHGNYCMSDIKLNSLHRSIPVLKACNFGTFGEGAKIPDDWQYEYLGAGNHLIIKKDVYEDFKKAIGNAVDPEDFYIGWLDAAWSVIEQQNKGKTPLDMKTPAELAMLGNAAVHNRKPMSAEEERLEEIQDDLEGGYDPFEDERVIVTSELVHGEDAPDCLKSREWFFDDFRSYLAELWSWEQTTNVTYYFPADDPLLGYMPNDEKRIEEYLVAKGKLIEGEEHHMKIMTLDCDGEEIYSVTVTIGIDDEEQFCEAYL